MAKKTPAKSARSPRSRAGKAAPVKKDRSGGISIGAASIGALALAAGGALLTLVARSRGASRSGGHAAPDLAPDQPHPGPDHRAPAAFRPDPTAQVSAADREALRPAPVPTLTAVNG